MVVERLDGVDRVIPVGQYVRPRTHYFAELTELRLRIAV